MQLVGENGVIEQYMIDRSNSGNADGTQASRMHLWLERKGVTELEDLTLQLLRQFLTL